MTISNDFTDYDLMGVRGNTNRVTLTLDATPGLLAVDQYKFWFYLKRNPEDADTAAIVRLDTTAGGVVVVDIPSRKVQAVIGPELTENLKGVNTLLGEWKMCPLVGGDVQSVDGGRGKLTFAQHLVKDRVVP